MTAKENTVRTKSIFVVFLMGLLLSVAGCTQRRSEADNVKKALEQADLKGVTVTDDADKNTVTLGGTLHSDEAKAKAGDVAKSAAPDRQIANEISVPPVGAESQSKAIESNLDDGIEHDYKAALLSKRMDKLSIHYNAKNGVLTLSGNVHNQGQRTEAEELASKVPNVQQVVNQLEVRR
jgi:hyperosmotically inducible periplasmic protein